MELGGVSVLENPELSRAASPMTYLSADRPTPPTLIMHGGRDLLVPFNQSCRLYATMKVLDKDVTSTSLTMPAMPPMDSAVTRQSGWYLIGCGSVCETGG